MLLQKPEVTFVELDLCDVITSSPGTGQQIDICTGYDTQNCPGESL